MADPGYSWGVMVDFKGYQLAIGYDHSPIQADCDTLLESVIVCSCYQFTSSAEGDGDPRKYIFESGEDRDSEELYRFYHSFMGYSCSHCGESKFVGRKFANPFFYFNLYLGLVNPRRRTNIIVHNLSLLMPAHIERYYAVASLWNVFNCIHCDVEFRA